MPALISLSHHHAQYLSQSTLTVRRTLHSLPELHSRVQLVLLAIAIHGL